MIFFDILNENYKTYGFFIKSGNTFNMDETGRQLNSEVGKVIATKRAKDVSTLTSSERGENLSVVACINAESLMTPPCSNF